MRLVQAAMRRLKVESVGSSAAQQCATTAPQRSIRLASDAQIGVSLALSEDEVQALAMSVAGHLGDSVPASPRDVGRVKRAAQAALVARCARATGASVDADRRVANIVQAVVPTVAPDDLRVATIDIAEGDGGELRSKGGRRPSFHSAYSSCALAVSAFGLWRLDPSTLELFGVTGFSMLRFEARLPIDGVPGRPPNLDLVAVGAGGVVAVESKLTEFITSKKTAGFREPYTDATKQLAHRTWADQFDRLRASPNEFRHFDAAQIIKHYLGLKSRYSNRPVTLGYVYWEPADARAYPLFAQHRAEITSFAEELADPIVGFVSCSYAELFSSWSRRRTPPTLRQHLAALADRYAVALGVGET